GRTHQIRVHMAYIGHPVAGDPVYGPKKVITSLGGQCLHAGHIGFKHPRTRQKIEIDSELPAYFTKFLRGLQDG
ncbi:MAG: RNA pseudouridine synthase, partial [Clostridia bacterium]|nr:RNA pseudouridine synthase [Clostridia bacterium]